MIAPFVEDPRTVAAGGTVRIVNGCAASGGVLERVPLPSNPLARFQIVEYLRAFLLAAGVSLCTERRSSSSPAPSASSARRARRCRRLPRRHDRRGHGGHGATASRSAARAGSAIASAFSPDPVCWTEAPEDQAALAKQRIRWQRGLAESLHKNARLLRLQRRGTRGLSGLPLLHAVRMLRSPADRGGGLRLRGDDVPAWSRSRAPPPPFRQFHAARLLARLPALGERRSCSRRCRSTLYPRASQLLVLVLVAAGPRTWGTASSTRGGGCRRSGAGCAGANASTGAS